MAEGQSTTVPSVEYRDVLDFPGYRVGDDGSVWSCLVKVSLGAGGGTTHRLGDSWKRLKPLVRLGGYLEVSLGSGNKRRAHVLVLEAFIGPRPAGMDGCHNDGNPANNVLSNLRWDTRSANMADAKMHGTAAEGESNGQSKLTREKVEAIRADRKAGFTYSQLTAKYGVSAGTLHPLVNGKTWKCVPDALG